MTIPHWLRHRWGPWQQYKIEVKEDTGPSWWQVRQRRTCQEPTCQKMQDELVR